MQYGPAGCATCGINSMQTPNLVQITFIFHLSVHLSLHPAAHSILSRPSVHPLTVISVLAHCILWIQSLSYFNWSIANFDLLTHSISHLLNQSINQSMYSDVLCAAQIMDLQDVLLAYCIHNPTVGYCQGMNFIVGMALIFMEPEDAFWYVRCSTWLLWCNKLLQIVFSC